MKKSLKTLSLIIFIVFAVYLTQTKRNLELTFVNATSQKEIEIEFSIDDEPPIKMKLESSHLPIDWIQRKVSFGQHELSVKSNDCNVIKSIQFFNFYRMEINLEFQDGEREICETQMRKSLFKLLYQ